MSITTPDILAVVGFAVLRLLLIVGTVGAYYVLPRVPWALIPGGCFSWTCNAWALGVVVSLIIVYTFVWLVVPSKLENRVEFINWFAGALIFYVLFMSVVVINNLVEPVDVDLHGHDRSFVFSFETSALMYSGLIGIPGAIWWINIWYKFIRLSQYELFLACVRHALAEYNLIAPRGPHPLERG